MRAAIYIRVSSTEQAKHGLSLAEQKYTLIQYAEAHNYDVVGIYADEGTSAYTDPKRRHEFQRMLKDCERGLIDTIVFLKLDRWFRNVKYYYITQGLLDRYGVRWECVLEDYDHSTRSGKLNFNMRLTIAEDESAAAGERVTFVFEGKIRRKEAITGNQPWGYTIKDKKVVKDPETEHIIEDMFRYYFSCLSAYETHQYLVDKYGITNDYNTTRRRIRHEAYTGWYKEIEDYRPAYITMDQHLFILNQAKKSHRSTPNLRTYLFNGLMKCPDCGRTLVSCTHNKRTQGYLCKRHYDKSCSFRNTVREDYIETILLNDIKNYVTSVKMRAAAKKKKTTEIDPVVYENRLKRLNDIYLMGNISDDDYRIKSAELKSKIADLRAPKPTTDSIPEDVLKLISGADFEAIYGTLDAKERSTLWHSIVDQIVVNENGRIEDILYLT